MKKIIVTVVLLGGLTLGLAETLPQTQSSISQVELQERMQKMNEMKEKMVQMSPEERKVAIEEMSASMPKDMQEKMQNKMQEAGHLGNGSQAQMKEYTTEMQTKENREMQQHQQMHQSQIANQFEHGVSQGVYTSTNMGDELKNNWTTH